MRNRKRTAAILFGAAILAVSGCGKGGAGKEITPTPVPMVTAVPSPTPEPSPSPTPTPEPKVIGVKTTLSKCLYLTNATGSALKQLYIRAHGSDDWGSSLIPAESEVGDSQCVQLYYMPEAATGSDTWYDVRYSDAMGGVGEISEILLERMSSAALRVENGEAYFIYMDIPTKLQRDTRRDEKPAPPENPYEIFDEFSDGSGSGFTDGSTDSADDSGQWYEPEQTDPAEGDGFLDIEAGDFDNGYTPEDSYTEPQEDYMIIN